MKRFLTAILFLSCIMSIKAQVGTVVNETVNTTTTTRVVEMGYSKYNRLSFSYASYKHRPEYEDEYEKAGSHSGFIAEYIHGWNLMKSQPLYFESGLACQCNFAKLHVGLDIPLEITYRYTLKNQFYIAPHAGFNLGINITDNEINRYPYYYDYNEKHFQLGYNVGLNFGHKKLNIGLGYRDDFMQTFNIYKDSDDETKVKAGTFYVGLGVNF